MKLSEVDDQQLFRMNAAPHSGNHRFFARAAPPIRARRRESPTLASTANAPLPLYPDVLEATGVLSRHRTHLRHPRTDRHRVPCAGKPNEDGQAH